MGTEDVACSECNTDLVNGQKYCSNCGIEIDWTDGVVNSPQINQPTSSSDSASWTKRRYQALGSVGKVIAPICILLFLIALWLMFGGSSSSDDLSKCNGLYDANILKTYGVFRCPASYDSAGSDYDSAGSDVYNIWLPLVIGFGLVIFSVLYGTSIFLPNL